MPPFVPLFSETQGEVWEKVGNEPLNTGNRCPEAPRRFVGEIRRFASVSRVEWSGRPDSNRGPPASTRALELLRADADGSGRRQALTRDLAAVEAELRNLAETEAKGGAVPIILEALEHREADCRRLQAELTACPAEHPATRKPAHVLRAQLRGFLDDWQGLLSRNVAEARPLLDLAPADRISFTPTADRRYQLTVPIVFDRVMTAAVPDLRGLQE